MATSFAALESRVNAACMQALANAEATLPDATVVSGIFDNAALVGGQFDIAPGYTRRFVAPTAALADLEVGDVLTIATDDFTITAIEPDGTGLTALGLK